MEPDTTDRMGKGMVSQKTSLMLRVKLCVRRAEQAMLLVVSLLAAGLLPGVFAYLVYRAHKRLKMAVEKTAASFL